MQRELSSEITEKSLSGLRIPACPASLTSIMKAAKQPSVDMDRLAQLISQDPGIAGPLIKLANSPYVGLRSKVSSVFQAMSVLGIQNTLNLVQNIALRQSMGDSTPGLEKFWEQSSLTASIAEKLAPKLNNISKDDAYVTALFYHSGIPVLMQKFPDYHETTAQYGTLGVSVCDIENTHFSTSHTIVGNMLTRSWLLPAHISKAILYHHDPFIFSVTAGEIEPEVRNIIALLHMAECIADEHLLIRDKAWTIFEKDVLAHFEMSAIEFSELKDDILDLLNGE